LKRTQTTEAGKLVTDIVMIVFRLDGMFMKAAEKIAGPAGLTAARWRVLGAVLREGRSVAEISRQMGLARQSVQPIADLLVRDGLASYQDNPRHKSAKLLVATESGLAVVHSIAGRQAEWANAVGASLEPGMLKTGHELINRLVDAVDGAEEIFEDAQQTYKNSRHLGG
jgi:DNA-binding MarR family transcriptional regulator